MQPQDLFQTALACLMASNTAKKIALTDTAAQDWRKGRLLVASNHIPAFISTPGRPRKPRLVSPRELPQRNTHTEQGRAALIHALCHIEFNAINLAWDAVYRFPEMPDGYYRDWIQIAKEEAYHFSLLQEHLRTLGYAYGDFDAHDGLWDLARETAHDPLVRMALVPRVMEARGLDVTPGIMRKLQAAGDARAVEILQIIHNDEIGHVETGSRWFRYLCEQRKLSSEVVFKKLYAKYMKGKVKTRIDHKVRKRAGFSEKELAYLESAN